MTSREVTRLEGVKKSDKWGHEGRGVQKCHFCGDTILNDHLVTPIFYHIVPPDLKKHGAIDLKRRVNISHT